MIENASKPSSGIIATLIGLATVLFGATIVFNELQDALNMIWKIPSKPKRGMVIDLLRDRFLSFVIVLGIGFLLLMTMLANTALTAIMQIFSAIIPSQLRGLAWSEGRWLLLRAIRLAPLRQTQAPRRYLVGRPTSRSKPGIID
jgi:uncharacterized BrkB/YihY/UPF0761 family membrane protein